MRIIFLGSGHFGVDSLRWLAQSEHEILHIITQPARRAGRGRSTLVPTPIAQTAERLNLPCLETENVNSTETINLIQSLNPNLMLVIAFGQKIGPQLLNTPNCRTINLHSSLLPKYRGAAPINWAIINGEKQTGLTIIELNDQWDAGKILAQQSTDIDPNENAATLHDRLAAMGPAIVETTLSQIADDADSPQPQNGIIATRAPKLKKSDGAINWNESAQRIHNQIRGLYPWPGAYCSWKKEKQDTPLRITITQAMLIHSSEKQTTPPGRLTDQMHIACGQGQIEILQIKPQGSNAMSFRDFANGRHIHPGDQLLNG